MPDFALEAEKLGVTFSDMNMDGIVDDFGLIK
jgi:hypothetical protein